MQADRTPEQPSDRAPADHEVSTWRLLWRLVAMGLQHKVRLAVALTVTVLMQLMVVGELFSSGLAIDVLRREVHPGADPPKWPLGLEPPADTPLMRVLLLVAGAALVFGVLRAVGYFLVRLTDELLAQAIVVDLRDRVYERLQSLPFSFYDTHDSGTIINRVTGDVQSVRVFIQGVLIRAFTALVAFVIYVIVMFSLHTWLTLICLAFGVFQILVMVRFSRRVRPQFRIQRKVLDDLIQMLSEAVQGIRVIRAFGRERREINRFDAQSEYARDQRYTIWRLVGFHMPLIMGAGFMSLAVLVGYGGYLVQIGTAEGGIALGTIWIFFGLLRSLAMQSEQIVRVAGQMPEALTGAERMFEILDQVPKIASPLTPIEPARLEDVPGLGIEFRNISFGYTVDQPILHDINLTIQPGETVAIVGPTGSGKSTLLQLIPRFYDPQQGQVLVGGVDVREMDLARLRRSIGVVFQEAFLFSNTLGNNVAFGRPDAVREVIVRATEVAAADAFLGGMPDSYDTIIGERGVTLSGGERQRISLARAVLIEPEILLLDDATSAVDAATEVRIQRRLDELPGTQTKLIVAHRLSTLRRADRVIVIEDGRITAEGSHADLMAHDSHYREAALIQLEDDTINGEAAK